MINSNNFTAPKHTIVTSIIKPQSKSNLSVKSFKIEADVWDAFVLKCKRDGSDASKEIRQFINRYLKR